MEPEILKVARAVLAAYEAHDTALDMADYARVAPALAREVIRLHAAVTDEDREAAERMHERVTRLAAAADFNRRDGFHGIASVNDAEAARYRRAADALLRPDETAALRRLLAEAREAVVTCLDVWPDGAVGQKCADLLARIDAATKGGGK